MGNPFTLSFGKKPVQYISRLEQTNQILAAFQEENPTNQLFMITGVRGSGKTVMLTNIASEMRKSPNWIVLELNPMRDILQSLAAKIYSIPEMHAKFVSAKLDFSAFGLGVSIENAAPVTDIENVLTIMLNEIKKKGKKLLITIDEVTNSEHIRIFASSFQIFMRLDAPIYLLMTGLYENIYELENHRELTFLYRAPKIILEPLNLTAIRRQYADIFSIDSGIATKMSLLTKGYPFAFQVLGYLYWQYRKQKTLVEILPEYDQYLDEFVYSKIWSELSETDRNVLTVLAREGGSAAVKHLRENLKMTSGLFSVYRDRLKRKGIIDTRKYGKISFSLPRFEVFTKEQDVL